MTHTRRTLKIAGLATLAAALASAQWSGRENELVIYAFSKQKFDLQQSPVGVSNGGKTGFVVQDSSKVAAGPLTSEFPAKRAQVLHNEPDDYFALITNLEGIISRRQENLITTKHLYLGGLLRHANTGSVSTKPLDVTGGLYVPFYPGLTQGPDVALEQPQFLLWSPSSTTPPFRAVADDAPSAFGPAGLTGVELEAFSGAAAFFVPWNPLKKFYPQQSFPQGVDFKLLDDDTTLGNRAGMIRFRPGRTSGQFTFTTSTHLFVLEGAGVVQSAGAAATAIPRGFYMFVPAGYSISISNPTPYSGPGASK